MRRGLHWRTSERCGRCEAASQRVCRQHIGQHSTSKWRWADANIASDVNYVMCLLLGNQIKSTFHAVIMPWFEMLFSHPPQALSNVSYWT